MFKAGTLAYWYIQLLFHTHPFFFFVEKQADIMTINNVTR